MRRHGSRGQALVEFALVFPIFMLLFFGLVDLGRYVFVTNSANQAAREAARANSVMGWTSACPTDATREDCIRRVVGIQLQGAAAPPEGDDAEGLPYWTRECLNASGMVRAGGLAGCRSGDTMSIEFHVDSFRLLTPGVAGLVGDLRIGGSAQVAFNN